MTTKRSDRTAVVLARLVDEVANVRTQIEVHKVRSRYFDREIAKAEHELNEANKRLDELESWHAQCVGGVISAIVLLGALAVGAVLLWKLIN